MTSPAAVLYADTSALVSACLQDEPDHIVLRGRLLEGDLPVVTSEITRVELASAVAAAVRASRLREPGDLLDRFDVDCADDGPVTLLSLDPPTVLPLARRLVSTHRLGTPAAVHLAVALSRATDLAGSDPVVLLTRDNAQAEAARAAGLAVA